jgi:hypothetical protein
VGPGRDFSWGQYFQRAHRELSPSPAPLQGKG